MKRFRSGDFIAKQISSRWWRLHYAERSDNAILMTGGNVDKVLEVPFPFVLKRIHLYHMDTNLAATKDEMKAAFRREEGQVTELSYFSDYIFKKEKISHSRVIISFEDVGEEGGLVYEAGDFTLRLNTTNTDLVQPLIYIKELK